MKFRKSRKRVGERQNAILVNKYWFKDCQNVIGAEYAVHQYEKLHHSLSFCIWRLSASMRSWSLQI